MTLPAEVREALGLEEGDTLLFSVVGDRIEAVPAALVPRDQLWFYTRQWQTRIREAEEDIREGRTRRFTSARQLLAHLDRLKK